MMVGEPGTAIDSLGRRRDHVAEIRSDGLDASAPARVKAARSGVPWPPMRLLSIADAPTDDDDARLRKRVGVAAGFVTIVAPLTLPFQAPGQPLAGVFGVALSLYSCANLAWLFRTHNFERYVITLLASAVLFVPIATFLGGGITGSSVGIVWAFLMPAYAIMALGPRRATPWFVAFLATIGVMTAVDPLIHEAVPRPPYPLVLIGLVQNTVVPLTIAFLLLRYTDTRRRAAEARVDELLTNAIPRSIAVRLKRGERRIADSYPEASVLFADIVGFTPWAQQTPPDRVVELLDGLFSIFDELTVSHGLEKIKTIGDAYMAVAGVPEPRSDHELAAVDLAGAMIAAVAELRKRTGVDLHVRIGVASGPVVAGVIGRDRLLFDLWGDTVNLASRMESFGVPDRIQVSASTRTALGDRWAFEEREVDVKGLGRLSAYLATPSPRSPVAEETPDALTDPTRV
jgi:adenylate cyclase